MTKAYSVKAVVLNSLHFGLAQNRKRLYIVGIKNEKGKVMKPPNLKKKAKIVSLQKFVDKSAHHPKVHVAWPVFLSYLLFFIFLSLVNTLKLTCITDWKVSKLAKTLRRNIRWGEKELAKKNVNPGEVPCVIDASAGNQKQVTIDRVPTITKSRGSGKNSFWLTSERRFLTVPELAKLQGFDYKMLKFDKDVPLSAQGGMIGNAMSLPVLKFVMKRTLRAAGMMKK